MRIGRQPLHDGDHRRQRLKGVLLTMLGAFCFALAPVWVRSIEAYSSTSIVFYRALIGCIPLMLVIMRSPVLRTGAAPASLSWKNRFVLCGIGLSMCSTAAFYYFAILKTTVAKAVLLHYTAPLYVALFSPLLLKEHNSWQTWLAVSLGFAGTALIVEPGDMFNSDPEEILGIVSAMLSGICLAGVFLFGRFLAGDVPSLVRTMYGSLVVVLLLAPWGLSIPAGFFLKNLPFLIILGTISLVVPYSLFFAAQNHISAQSVSTTALFEPVCGVGIGFLLYGEQLSLLGGLGAVAVLSSIYLSSRRKC